MRVNTGDSARADKEGGDSERRTFYYSLRQRILSTTDIYHGRNNDRGRDVAMCLAHYRQDIHPTPTLLRVHNAPPPPPL